MSSNWFDILHRLAGIRAIPRAIHRVLLYGPPGVGKSYAAYALFMREHVLRITCHGERIPESFGFGQVALQGGSTVELPSLVARAMEQGSCLVIDEIDRLPSSCHSAMLAALDDTESCAIYSELTGEKLSPTHGFCVFATTNESPKNLDPALLDRFDLLLHCNAPSLGLLENLTSRARRFLENLVPPSSSLPVCPQQFTPRSLRRFERLAAVVGDDDAAELLFGSEAAPNFVASVRLAGEGGAA